MSYVICVNFISLFLFIFSSLISKFCQENEAYTILFNTKRVTCIIFVNFRISSIVKLRSKWITYSIKENLFKIHFIFYVITFFILFLIDSCGFLLIGVYSNFTEYSACKITNLDNGNVGNPYNNYWSPRLCTILHGRNEY